MLTPDEKERYARHLLLPGFGEEAQLRLKKSKVLIIGAGGLGSPVALYLTAAGVGHLTIIDADQVELSNLQRQILHSTEDISELKVDSSRKRLSSLNPDLSIRCIPEFFSVENAEELVIEHDLVIDGSDNFPTRFLVNDACYFQRKPLIYGSIFQFEGQLTFFHRAENTPCYRCLVPEVPEEGAVPNCLEAGVLGTLPGIIGSLQAMEALKYLSGLGTLPAGKMLYYNGLETSFKELSLQKDPQCPLCGEHASIHKLEAVAESNCDLEFPSITAKELHAIMKKDPSLFLLDVREPEEYAERRIPGSQLVPLGELEEKSSFFPQDKKIFVHCKSGVRSQKALSILSKKGLLNLINIRDGIDGWDF